MAKTVKVLQINVGEFPQEKEVIVDGVNAIDDIAKIGSLLGEGYGEVGTLSYNPSFSNDGVVYLSCAENEGGIDLDSINRKIYMGAPKDDDSNLLGYFYGPVVLVQFDNEGVASMSDELISTYTNLYYFPLMAVRGKDGEIVTSMYDPAFSAEEFEDEEYLEDDEEVAYETQNSVTASAPKVKVGDEVTVVYIAGALDGESGVNAFEMFKSGTVKHIDPSGGLHGTWGPSVLRPGVDVYTVIEKDEPEEYEEDEED